MQNSNLGEDMNGMTVHEKLDEILSKTIKPILLASNVSTANIDCSSYDGYENFTKANFLLDVLSIYEQTATMSTQSLTIDKSYDKSTGILTVTGIKSVASNYTLRANFDIYLIK